jgi:hypothetical protein
MISSRLKSQSTPYSTGAAFRRKFATVDNGIGMETAHDMTPQAQQAFIAIGDVTYPIAWQTEKQRKAYFATDGFGKGIPTKRTGEHTRAWVFVWKSGADGEGALTLQNRKKGARFIFGGFRPGNGFQQRMHKPNWPNAIAQRDRLFESAKKMRRQKFQEALKGFGTLIFTGRR